MADRASSAAFASVTAAAAPTSSARVTAIATVTDRKRSARGQNIGIF